MSIIGYDGRSLYLDSIFNGPFNGMNFLDLVQFRRLHRGKEIGSRNKKDVYVYRSQLVPPKF